MTINADNMIRLIMEEFGGNMSKCASILGISRSTIYRVANGKSNAGLKLVSRVLKYCERKEIEVENYISILH